MALLDRVILDKENSLPLVSSDLISPANLGELRKFWMATSNLAYLSELYVYTKFDVTAIRTYELPRAQQYPSAVAPLMKRNPILSRWWKKSSSDFSDPEAKTIEQLRDLTNTFQSAAKLMRAHFKTHPPERTARYKKNMALLSDYLKVISVDACDTEQDCAGLPLHTKTITVNISILTLMLGKVDGRLRILVVGIIDD